MEANTPEPISRPVEPAAKPAMNVPPTTLPTHTAGSGSTPLGAPAGNVGKPKKGKKILLWLLILILLGAAVTFGYLWWQQKQSISTAQSTLQTAKDEAEKKLADAEKQVKELKAAASTSPSQSPTPKTDTEAIIIAVKAFAPTAAIYKADGVTYGTPKVSTKDKNFASVTVSVKGVSTQFYVILKKVDSVWQPIYGDMVGTAPTAAAVQMYGIPTDMP